MIKFMKYYVQDSETKIKARIFYSIDNRIDNRKCVTLYAKDYTHNLRAMFDDHQNDTDTMTDYFDKGRVILFKEHPLYNDALIRAKQ